MNQSILNKSRRDKFTMVIDIPVALKKKIENVPSSTSCGYNIKELLNANTIQYSLYGTPVPRVSVAAIEAPYGGQVHRNTTFSRPSYAPLTIGMSIDNRFFNYWLLWTWINLWNDTRTAEFDPARPITFDNSIEDYVTSFTVYALDEYDNRLISFSYKNVIITELSEIEFSYRNIEEIGCTATFVFDQMFVNLEQVGC